MTNKNTRTAVFVIEGVLISLRHALGKLLDNLNKVKDDSVFLVVHTTLLFISCLELAKKDFSVIGDLKEALEQVGSKQIKKHENIVSERLMDVLQERLSSKVPEERLLLSLCETLESKRKELLLKISDPIRTGAAEKINDVFIKVAAKVVENDIEATTIKQVRDTIDVCDKILSL